MNIDKEYIVKELLNYENVVKAVFVTKKVETDTDYKKIVIRPLIHEPLKRFQIDYYTEKKHIKEFVAIDASNQFFSSLFDRYFDHIHIQTLSHDLHFRMTKKGKMSVTKGKPSCKEIPLLSTSNRVKDHPFREGEQNLLLEKIEVMDGYGKVFPSKYKKFRQINQFIKFITELHLSKNSIDSKENILLVDCGCGKAYLTFGVFYFFNFILNRTTTLIGIDNNADIINKCKKTQNDLGFKNMAFHISEISDFQLSSKPDIVFSLHACDNATDAAIAQAIHWGAASIIAAPCCQHELHNEIENTIFEPMLRHGILRERTADILTDTMRSLALRIMGYKAEILEFISTEYTSKNIVIRAEKKVKAGEQHYLNQYTQLKEFWGISTLAIEDLIGDDFKRYFRG